MLINKERTRLKMFVFLILVHVFINHDFLLVRLQISACIEAVFFMTCTMH